MDDERARGLERAAELTAVKREAPPKFEREDVEPESSDVAGYGSWSVIPADARGATDLELKMTAIAEGLGRWVGGRGGAFAEVVSPRSVDEAHPRSLSAAHGLGRLPLHVELSHRPRPCRYVLLGCVREGATPVATTLLDRREMRLTRHEEAELRNAPVLVRAGRRSFYSTLLAADGRHLRYDRECIVPVEARGRYALDLLERRIAECTPQVKVLKAGEVLVIDNWLALHGREPAANSAGRGLLRMMVDG